MDLERNSAATFTATNDLAITEDDIINPYAVSKSWNMLTAKTKNKDSSEHSLNAPPSVLKHQQENRSSTSEATTVFQSTSAVPVSGTVQENKAGDIQEDDEPLYSVVRKPSRPPTAPRPGGEAAGGPDTKTRRQANLSIFPPNLKLDSSLTYDNDFGSDSGAADSKSLVSTGSDGSGNSASLGVKVQRSRDDDETLYQNIDYLSVSRSATPTSDRGDASTENLIDAGTVVTDGVAYDPTYSSIANLCDNPASIEEPASSAVTVDRKQFNVRYCGTMTLTEEDMKGEKSSQTVRNCIVYLAVPTSRDIDTLHEWSTELKMQLVVDRDRLSLVECQTNSTLVSHELRKVRIWGTGKEPNSRSFAYVARSAAHAPRGRPPIKAGTIPATSGGESLGGTGAAVSVAGGLGARGAGGEGPFVCRVLHCEECIAQTISASVRVACERKAKERRAQEGLTRGTEEGNTATKAASGERFAVQEQRAGGQDEDKQQSQVEPLQLLNGATEDSSNTVERDLRTVVEAMCSASKQDNWVRVAVEISPTTVLVKERNKPSSVIVNCRTSCIKYFGIYSKCNKFGSIHLQSNSTSSPELCLESHVFYCEPSAELWHMNIQEICGNAVDLTKDKNNAILKKIRLIFKTRKR